MLSVRKRLDSPLLTEDGSLYDVNMTALPESHVFIGAIYWYLCCRCPDPSLFPSHDRCSPDLDRYTKRNCRPSTVAPNGDVQGGRGRL